MHDSTYIETYESPQIGLKCDIYQHNRISSDHLGDENIFVCKENSSNKLFGGVLFTSIESARKAIDLSSNSSLIFTSKPGIKDALDVWNRFNAVLINDDGELDSDFMHFPVGTHRYDVWKWIECEYGVSVGEDLLGL